MQILYKNNFTFIQADVLIATGKLNYPRINPPLPIFFLHRKGGCNLTRTSRVAVLVFGVQFSHFQIFAKCAICLSVCLSSRLVDSY